MRTAGQQFKSMTVDELTERISILYRRHERNEKGDIVSTAELERAKVWAKVFPRGARRDEQGVEKKNELEYSVTIRYRKDVAPDDELDWRARRLKQTAPPLDVEGRRIWLRLECKEMIADEASRV